MEKWLASFLCAVIVFFGASPIIATVKKTEEIAINQHLLEYFEYETIVLSMLYSSFNPEISNWRELYLLKVAKYKEFINKYPDSLLLAEVKLRIAELYKDVEKKEVYQFRVELYRCLADYSYENAGTLE